MKLEVTVKSVYGKFLAYPANQAAEDLADLLKVKTFSAAQLEGVGKLGLEVVEVVRPAQRKVCMERLCMYYSMAAPGSCSC